MSSREAFTHISPAYFGFVMATGILATAFYKTGWIDFAWSALWLGFVAFCIFILIFAARLLILKREVLEDLKDVERMFKYLTFSAGSNALALPFCLFGFFTLGWLLAWIGMISTILLTYALFCALFFHTEDPIEKISPFWLLLAIACNSSGIALTTLWHYTLIEGSGYLLFAFSFWTFGVFIYTIFMALNLYRMIFVPFVGEDMDPCYWTCMGAAAIAVVDGTQLIQSHDLPLFLQMVQPFIKGFVLFLWSWGSAWIPILILMEVWKYFYYEVPFHYQPSRWAMVFPLGMYTMATFMLGTTDTLEFLQNMVPFFLWITVAAWAIVAFMSPYAKKSA